MAAELSTTDSGYTNRPPIRAQLPRRLRRDGQSAGRAVDRMRTALAAYEQRAERRAALRSWILARAGTLPNPS